MKYIHTETGEEWSGQASTSRTSNFYLLTHEEKVALGWELVDEPVVVESKEEAIAKMKNELSMHLLSKYPFFKQINASLGVYGDDYVHEMKTEIQRIRALSDEYESQIKLGTFKGVNK